MTPQEFCLLVISILTSAVGQFFLKSGALKIGKSHTGNLAGFLAGAIASPELVAGLACYGLGVVAYILLLSRVKLSVAGPALASGYVFSVLLGYFAFGEAIPLKRVLGLGLIVFGVILVLWKE
ncbi:EamA family transporter [Kamptonema formosum]|uniref:EamA family transporter n=1 Tax=Kamptonema formosum TaxID=331992 RepID=UPI00034DA99F|nr:EamA family transporter [Oscillatoria sp. PCC 10802]